ncbi:MAG: cyanophycinase [Alphaproteobacteria bacterium]|jgi:cyanophycinase
MVGRRALLSMPLALWAEASIAAEPKSSGPANGTLLIVGGGSISSAVIAVAQRHAGGTSARWVVIPSAQSDRKLATSPVQQFISAVGPYSVLHTEDRATANSDAFVAPFARATAVWISGGRQWRLVDAYGGTRTEQALHELLARGGLIAGSSAGASIMGSYLVRGSPSGNAVLMSPGHERGFGFLRNVAIDQHIVVRGRESDLARLSAVHPEILGIGIDEGTAILVQGNSFSVVGPSVVAITDGAMHDGRPYYLLKQGARFHLATWSVLAGSP